MGKDNFDVLTLLAEKHHLLSQNLFAHPEEFTDIRDELTNVQVATILASMGNELYKRQIIDDAEKAYRITLALRAEHFAARGSLAAICYDSGRLSEAKEHAMRAITDMDSQAERYKDVPVPQHIADPNAMRSFRSTLQLIVEGKTFDESGTATTPVSNPLLREITSKVIDRLDLILWELSKVILGIYVERFPDDSNEHNFTRAGTLVNELVRAELRGEQVTFKANNPGFVAREKNELFRMEKVRKGVISFLVAKAALYKCSGHSDAEIWIERAQELEPDVEIPDTLDEISRVIESCLSYYESC